jgi:serine/threonine protein kinase
MALASGTKLGPYETVSPLGAGGMGEVYRARDTRLDRTVAIKILPAHLSDNPEAKQRFEGEAKAISKLNHPHICTLHDIGHQDGVDFLVMELVEGETLEQRLSKGPLPSDQTIRYAAQVADALSKAHKLGFTHRDLKPANIMLTKSGTKLMDFGLAKQAGPAPLAAGLTAMTMEQSKLTGEGTIVGTFQYMAPEQLEGKEADARTDIFALGEVLYEMVTGKPAFNGKSRASLIAAILTAEPPLITQLQPLTPPALERVVTRCLAKDPDERWQTATDLASELNWIAAGSQSGVPPANVWPIRRMLVLGAVVGLALLALTVTSARLNFRPPPASPPRARWIITPPDKFTFHPTGDIGGPVVVSPDGQRLAFAAVDANGKQLLWVRRLDSLQAEPLLGTEGSYYPFWSPDSQSLGFFSNGQLKRVSANGGSVVSLCNVVNARGGSWNQHGIIVLAPDYRGVLYRVPATGGNPEPVTRLDSKHDSHRWPYFLPDGEHFLYLAVTHDSLSHADEGIYVASLDGKENKFLLRTRANGAYADGHMLYLNESTLMAQPFDLRRLELAGEPTALEEGVEEAQGWMLGVFSVSQNGVLSYAPASPGNQLVSLSRSGQRLGLVADVGRYQSLRLSPDGQYLAVEHERPSHHLWIYDLKHNSKSQFTFGSSANAVPVWSPDGKEIVFASDRKGHTDLYRKSVSGSDVEHVLLESTSNKFPISWSPDGKFLLYSESDQYYRANLWVLSFDGSGSPHVLLTDDFYSTDGIFSPDGHWIAYTSREQGNNQIFVTAFPGPGTKRQISFAGGSNPIWRRDGGALFYLDDSGNLCEAEVSLRNADLSVGNATTLFRSPAATLSGQGLTYDVTPDGRFIVNTLSQENQAQIIVVSNWNAKLKK